MEPISNQSSKMELKHEKSETSDGISKSIVSFATSEEHKAPSLKGRDILLINTTRSEV